MTLTPKAIRAELSAAELATSISDLAKDLDQKLRLNSDPSIKGYFLGIFMTKLERLCEDALPKP